jgi:2-polyprenyl-3-methyl-5-hydroxy-6-metoxy-1,4-benzoquinol methylase
MNEQQLRARIEKSPKNAHLRHKLGSFLYQKGDIGGALGSFLLALLLKPDNIIFLQNCLHVLGTTSGYQLPDSIRDILIQWVGHDDVDIQDMSMVIHNQYGASPLMGTLLKVLEASEEEIETILASDHFDILFNDALLQAVMQKAIIITPILEQALTELRRHVLRMSLKAGSAGHAMSGRMDFLASLACQCFNTEYVYAISEEEQKWLNQLIEGELERDHIQKWVIIGAYQPLHTIMSELSGDLSPAMKFLIKRQFLDFQAEQTCRESITPLTEVNDDISKKVQQQYERYPYPRWIRYSRATPKSFRKFICERFPDQKKNKIAGGAIDLLIPGCGTGMQICKLASAISPANITALDISRTSLAYAMRAVEENDFKTVKYFHADIMELGEDDQSYDYIDCTGVLHHLGEPERGLANLVSMLRPGGYMRLALYSERGRQDVVAARRYVLEKEFEDSEQGVRDFRKAVRNLPDGHPVATVSENQDFYSISGLHDLIFNINENRYTPKELKVMLDGAGLQFLGFDHMDASIPGRYSVDYPADSRQRSLDNWDQFEQKNPDTFGFMYLFWCRKPVI